MAFLMDIMPIFINIRKYIIFNIFIVISFFFPELKHNGIKVQIPVLRMFLFQWKFCNTQLRHAFSEAADCAFKYISI